MLFVRFLVYGVFALGVLFVFILVRGFWFGVSVEGCFFRIINLE